MEKYTSSCRLILYCTNPTKVIEPVRSRCLGIRVGAPTEMEVCSVLSTVARKEGLQLPDTVALRVAKVTNAQLRHSISPNTASSFCIPCILFIASMPILVLGTGVWSQPPPRTAHA